MKTDAQLKRDVLAELEWDPSINATRVGVSNNLTLRERQASEYGAQRIHDALTRYAEEEAKSIAVIVEAGTATLRGTVATLAERTAVQTAAWSAPGICRVVNELKVQS